MAVTVTICNGTAAELTNVNAGGADCPAGECISASLSAAELETLLGNDGVAVFKSSSDGEERRKASKVMRLGRNPGVAVSSAA